MNSYDLNERLLCAVNSSYEEVLSCLCDGAKANLVSAAYGRTAIGAAAIVGDAEILELLIQSCEEPDLDLFVKKCSNSIEIETDDSTPDGMDNLEWEDEFIADNAVREGNDPREKEEDTSLFFYYAKTFERTGAIISNLDESSPGHSRGLMPQDPHASDAMMMTPLHYAAACSHLDCARILLDHGARADAINMDGITPLHCAQSDDMARLLLQHGANINLKTLNTGETALHLALRHRCVAVATTILQTTNVNINETDDELDQTPLICAIICDLDDIANALLDKGARINLQDREGHTALYYAVERKNLKMAARLLALGARRITAHYLLHHCVRHEMRDMAELLVNHGDCLNVRNKEGVTPIMMAILAQQPNILEYLLQVAAAERRHGKPLVDRVENELIIAVQYIDTLPEFTNVARLIFAYGDQRWMSPMAASTCYIPYCHTPLARAIMLNKLDIAAFLIKEGVDTTQMCRDHVVNHLRSTIAPGCLELSQLLVHAGYKFPYRKLPVPTTSQPEQRNYEEAMQQLCTNPLTLQSHARIVIRQQLREKMTDTKFGLPAEWHATKLESGFCRMINQLDIPTTLRVFLIHFDDCPSVNNSKTYAHLETHDD